MDPRENLSTAGPQPNEGEFCLFEEHVPPMTFLPVRGANRPLFPPASSHFQPLKLKSLYWKKSPKSKSFQSKPGACFSVHLLSVLPGHVNEGALLNCTRVV
jgi:hypothetical protein